MRTESYLHGVWCLQFAKHSENEGHSNVETYSHGRIETLLLGHFEKKMITNPKVREMMALPYIRTDAI